MTDRQRSPDFLTQTTSTGKVGGPRRRDPGRRGSGFSEGGRATVHHGAGGRKGRRQRRIVVSVLPEQGGDPVPAASRRMAADDRVAVPYSGRRPDGAARTVAQLGPCVPPFGVRRSRDARGARRCRAPLPRCAGSPGREGVGRPHRPDLHAGGAALGFGRDAPPRLRSDHDDTQRRGKHFSETPRTEAEIATYADAMADMFCAYLLGLDERR